MRRKRKGEIPCVHRKRFSVHHSPSPTSNKAGNKVAGDRVKTKPKPRWDVHLSGDDDQPGFAG